MKRNNFLIACGLICAFIAGFSGPCIASDSSSTIVAAKLDADPEDDIIINFGPQYGTWIYYNNSTWFQLHTLSPKSITKVDLDGISRDDLIVDFGPQYGIWIYYNNSTWQQLHTISAEQIVTADIDNNGQDDVVVDFGTQDGIWIYYNNSIWQQLNNTSPKSMTAGNLDSNPKKDLIVDFGPQYGIWIYYNNSTWQQLHNISAEFITAADIDHNGQDDIIVDFGSQYGIWIYYNNSIWQKLHDLSAWALTLDNTLPTGSMIEPSAGQTLSGIVAIRGTAEDLNFSIGHLYYGQGASPASWNLIGDVSGPVGPDPGPLGNWDTSRLPNGNYVIRLSVSDNAGNVRNVDIPVTLRNIGIVTTAIDYSYDDLNRLKSVAHDNINVTYGYDEVGNIKDRTTK